MTNATHINLKTFHRDASGNIKEKRSDIPVLHIAEGSIREYEDKGQVCPDKSIITFGFHKHLILMSYADLKRELSEKLNMKFA